ncbi:hypothetical protein ZHAS_00004197 [Anopheles sinensis]|uniref:Uncharacterized protein n=1 Tax=Anopheles sinensis TaxID=74873 RepID=A0A084VGB9_ANOSI|nr:hypothetical protein ZHAS_00004197 [Anopheles sinensis]
MRFAPRRNINKKSTISPKPRQPERNLSHVARPNVLFQKRTKKTPLHQCSTHTGAIPSPQKLVPPASAPMHHRPIGPALYVCLISEAPAPARTACGRRRCTELHRKQPNRDQQHHQHAMNE